MFRLFGSPKAGTTVRIRVSTIILRDKQSSLGFTFADTALALLISALAIGMVPPLLKTLMHVLPAGDEKLRDVSAYVYLYEDLRRTTEKIRIPYWSVVAEPESNTGSVFWYIDEHAVDVISGENRRRYSFRGKAPSLVAVNRDGCASGIEIVSAGGVKTQCRLTERPLQSVKLVNPGPRDTDDD